MRPLFGLSLKERENSRQKRRKGRETVAEQQSTLWRIWVDEESRVVSFTETEGARKMEFSTREEFLRQVDEFTARNFRYR